MMLNVIAIFVVAAEPVPASASRYSCMKGRAWKLKARVAPGWPTTKLMARAVLEPLRPEASALPPPVRKVSAAFTVCVLVEPGGNGGICEVMICASPRAYAALPMPCWVKSFCPLVTAPRVACGASISLLPPLMTLLPLSVAVVRDTSILLIKVVEPVGLLMTRPKTLV
ncbi:hypothetical protein D3C81_1070250 [compost metagenome]